MNQKALLAVVSARYAVRECGEYVRRRNRELVMNEE
jgi:hypothetical protein